MRTKHTTKLLITKPSYRFASLKPDLSTLFVTYFVRISLQFILLTDSLATLDRQNKHEAVQQAKQQNR